MCNKYDKSTTLHNYTPALQQIKIQLSGETESVCNVVGNRSRVMFSGSQMKEEKTTSTGFDYFDL